ncbi:ferritin-like protein [Streptomyces sp. NPDC020917]|uniref:ferritin-like protein n=1 Tax=Streptomyces sp. NPDC020917 TaxID=3365102 RepID=UPI0037B34892
MTGISAGGGDRASFRRRSLLASAAAAAVGPLNPVMRAAAAPGGTPVSADGAGSVVRLLAVAGGDRDLDWIKTALQIAVELELSTLPPYLCAWWSVKDRTGQAARLIRRIVDDEMYHLGVVCNLLVAVGGRPRIKDAAPVYPGPLPGGVRAGLTVYLSGLTRAFVHDVLMAIEAPETPLARSGEGPPTIGAFYGELLNAFQATAPALSADRQLAERIGTHDLEPVRSLDDVERALEAVKEQGEGTSSSPSDTFGDDQPAHYYAFGEIYHGCSLQQTAGGWEFTGAPIPFPDARPMAPAPSGGWTGTSAHVTQLLSQFDTTYHSVLDSLETAWSGGGQRSLDAAIHAMRGLEPTAVELMTIPIPNASGTYGPLFRPPVAP